MLDLVLDNATKEDTNDICRALRGWEAFVNNEIIVYDATDKHPAGMIIGPKDDGPCVTIHATIGPDILPVTERLESAVKTIEQWRDEEYAKCRLATDLAMASLSYQSISPFVKVCC